ncbi:thymocyte nuclear protein 1, partial [Polytolypa hystricis UAMH7299]
MAPTKRSASPNGEAASADHSMGSRTRSKRVKGPVEETAAASRPRRSGSTAVSTSITNGDEKGTTTRTRATKTAGTKTASKAKGTTTTITAKKGTGKVGRPRKITKNSTSTTTAPAKENKAPKANGTANVLSDEDDGDDSSKLSSVPASDDEMGDVDEDSSKSYWLMKAEPESRFEKGVDVKFSIDDLREAKEPEPWDARNNMRAMRKGDLAFFYHSNCKTPGIAGIMEIVREHSVD